MPDPALKPQKTPSGKDLAAVIGVKPRRLLPILNALVLICMVVQAPLSNAQAPSKAPGDPVRMHCSPEVTVQSRDRADSRSVCRGALAAIDFLAKQGVEVSEPLEVNIVDALPAGVGASAVGCFNPRDHQAYVLSYRMFLNRGKWLGLQIDRRLYESIASHEVAHAMTWCAAASPPLTLQATEYIAFVTMFMTMDTAQLNALLAENPGIVFESDWEVSELGYALNPIRFGIMAYRHYLRKPDPAGFIRAILAGKAFGPRYYIY